MSFAGVDRFAWMPTEAVTARARLTRFLADNRLASWDDLYRRSITDIPGFTEDVLRFLDIRFRKPYTTVLDLGRPFADRHDPSESGAAMVVLATRLADAATGT